MSSEPDLLNTLRPLSLHSYLTNGRANHCKIAKAVHRLNFGGAAAGKMLVCDAYLFLPMPVANSWPGNLGIAGANFLRTRRTAAPPRPGSVCLDSAFDIIGQVAAESTPAVRMVNMGGGERPGARPPPPVCALQQQAL